MDALLHFAAKAFVTAGLLVVALACGWKIRRLWFDHTIYLSTFSYSKDSDLKPESARRFVEATDVALQGITELYGGTEAANVMPDADGAGAAQPAFVQPIVMRSDIPQIEIEAYGLPLGRLVREINRYIDASGEIVGSASERASRVEVYARIRGGGHQQRSWYIASAPSFDDASYDLACNIYHALAPQDSLLSGIRDDEFITFTRALRDYSEYRRQSLEPENKAASESSLKRASGSVEQLVAKNDGFALAHKLRATVAVEEKNYVLAQSSLVRYSALLKASKRADSDLKTLLASAAVPTSVASASGQEPTSPSKGGATAERLKRVRPLRPGISIGLANEQNAVGTLSCFVKDADGTLYALSVSGLITAGKVGDQVVQPSLLDGGTLADSVGEIAYITPTADTLEVSYALIKLHASDSWSNDIPNVGTLRAVADGSLGSAVTAVGRTSGPSAAVINSIHTDVKVVFGDRTVIFLDVYAIRQQAGGGVSAAGDSGAPVVDREGRLVGIVFAGSPTVTLVMPITSILRAGNLKLAG